MSYRKINNYSEVDMDPGSHGGLGDSFAAEIPYPKPETSHDSIADLLFSAFPSYYIYPFVTFIPNVFG